MEYTEKLKNLRDAEAATKKEVKFFDDEIQGSKDSIGYSERIIAIEKKKMEKFTAERALAVMKLSQIQNDLEKTHAQAEKEAQRKPLLKKLADIRNRMDAQRKLIAP